MRRFTRPWIPSLSPVLLPVVLVVMTGSLASAQDEAGRRVEAGSLEAGDPRLVSGEYHDDYVVDAQAGAIVILDLHSPDFNAFVQMSPQNNAGPGRMREWHNDDASKQNTDAGLAVTLPDDGPYTVYVTTSTPGEAGQYLLGITILEAPHKSEAGSLAADDRKLDTGEYCDYYEFQARQGELWVADVVSEDFDTYLFGRSVDDSSYRIDNDDTFGEQRHSQVLMKIPRDGTYFIGVTSAQTGETGEYRVTLSSTEAVGVPPRFEGAEGVAAGARSLGGATRSAGDNP